MSEQTKKTWYTLQANETNLAKQLNYLEQQGYTIHQIEKLNSHGETWFIVIHWKNVSFIVDDGEIKHV